MKKSENQKEWQEVQQLAAERILQEENCNDEKALRIIEEIAFQFGREKNARDLYQMIRRIYGRMRGPLGELSYLLEDRNINEIMINGPDRVFIERRGELEEVEDGYSSVAELEKTIRKIAGRVHREINERQPILDARLEDGSRVNAVLGTVAIGGPVLTVRRFSEGGLSVQKMIEGGTISPPCAEDLRDLVIAGYNIFVSGGTSSGKTTFLNTLSDFLPAGERVVVIEDSIELNLRHVINNVRLECRNANAAGTGEINMDDLIKASLRMRPDRIIVGEVRGKEVSSMLQALNTGHSGMSTGHGNSVEGMLRRLEAMYISGADIPLDAVRMQIVEAVDVMVHMARLSDGSRRVVAVKELTSYENGQYRLHSLYEMDKDLRLSYTGCHLKNDMKLRLRGIRNARLQNI